MAQFETVRRTSAGVQSAEIDAGLRAHMNKVYGLMAIAMVITGIIAYVVGTDAAVVINAMKQGMDPASAQTAIIPPSVIAALFFSPLKWVIMFAPLAVVFAFGAMLNRMSTSTATMVFYGFAALMGLSISWIFAVFTGISIAQTFFVTAIAFGGLSLYGYTTKRDLSGMGAFLVMGVIGILVASIVNIWLASPALHFAVSVIGVLLFAGLTAFDTQNIKNTYLQVRSQPGGEVMAEKMAISGALNLYLDFLNMFMFLLQLMGNRN
ncbi:Bax inhibitor-1/YccA family protein [Paroceanicella profunda]|uniref:Bax inhibitor-1/YccA family protein n=1 Tax=Paroceanicella profunda TaxID=2579971 RepID=A0A5B8FWG6_9RHOB|nr:Bax inhibitor-1/YccA family protein [Paroceanicella profunda]QDL90732.1 Bax inhibitor-1/YccA family protein [Paroceanicella profunda]